MNWSPVANQGDRLLAKIFPGLGFFELLLPHSEGMGRQSDVSVLIFVPFAQRWCKWRQARAEGSQHFILKSNTSASFVPALWKINAWKKYRTSLPYLFFGSLGWKAAWWMTWEFPRSSPLWPFLPFLPFDLFNTSANSHTPHTCPGSNSTAQLFWAALQLAAEPGQPEGFWKDTAFLLPTQCLPSSSRDEHLWHFSIYWSPSFLRTGDCCSETVKLTSGGIDISNRGEFLFLPNLVSYV